MDPRGIGKLSTALVFMLYAGIAVSVFTAGLWIMRSVTGTPPIDEEAGGAIDIGAGLLLFATYFIFGRWLWVASRNLWDREVNGLQFSPASCIWWHAVPIANLFKPFQAMREIWNGSHGATSEFLQESNATLNIWWGLWIVSNVLGNIAFRLQPEAPAFWILDSGLNVVLNGFAARLVMQVRHAQTNGHEHLMKTFS